MKPGGLLEDPPHQVFANAVPGNVEEPDFLASPADGCGRLLQWDGAELDDR